MVVEVGSSLEASSLTLLMTGGKMQTAVALQPLFLPLCGPPQLSLHGGFRLVRLLLCIVFYREQHTQETAALFWPHPKE